MKKYYDSLATEFEETDKFWSNPYDVATWDMENRLIRCHLSETDDLLDLGVGFYPHVESTANKHVTCVDISEQSLLVARRVYGCYNSNMEFVCADALNLPFADEAFGGIVAGGELINHVQGEILLKEMYRVLRPGGRVILSVGMKWCIDSLYAVLDSFLGNTIGYSMTPQEAGRFVLHPRDSSQVTWKITPDLGLTVTLYSHSHLKQMLSRTAFRIVQIRSLNLSSGIVPLPLQQDSRTGKAVVAVTRILLRLDAQLLSRLPGIRWFAGNAYLVLEKPR